MPKFNIFDLIAPNDCINCGKQGEIICNNCVPSYISVVPSECFRCSKQTQNFKLCPGCYKVLTIKQVWRVCHYDQPAKQIINTLKFQPNRSMALKVAELIDVVVPHQNWLVVPLPTAPQRARQRGFDHANLIAKEFAKLRNISSSHALLRKSNTRQVGTKKAERWRQTEDIFLINKADVLRGATVLLIDDVVTTGASLSEAAKTLKKAGAKSVSAAVYAVARLN